MLFTLTDDPQIYALEVFLTNILMIGLFCSNNRIVIFSKTGKKFKSQQTHTFKMSRWKGDGGVLRFVTFLQIIVFEQKIYCSFLQIKGLAGIAKLVILYGRHKCMAPERFKIIINSIISDSSFFFNIKPQTRYILTA